ncbi:MAG: hypothetical protein QGG48_08265, partial [Desulfatiglandales bacterium]|nr:hypothetical protein [Desulfatiglandales bacterium]
FYTKGNNVLLMNLEVWNKLPSDLQKHILDVTEAYEHDMAKNFENLVAKEWKRMDEIGVKRLNFNKEDTEKFLASASDAKLEEIEKKIPDLAPTLKKVSGWAK